LKVKLRERVICGKTGFSLTFNGPFLQFEAKKFGDQIVQYIFLEENYINFTISISL